MIREITHLFCFLIHSDHAFFRDTKQAGHQFILPGHFFLREANNSITITFGKEIFFYKIPFKFEYY